MKKELSLIKLQENIWFWKRNGERISPYFDKISTATEWWKKNEILDPAEILKQEQAQDKRNG